MTDSGLYGSNLLWLGLFAVLYWAYCIFWGVRGAREATTASAYFVAGRSLNTWVFVMAATATSFAGWLFIGGPALILRDGLQASYIAFAAVVVPLTGVIFLKRQWILGKRFGFVTPGEMFAAYYGSDIIRVFTVVVALLFAIPFLGMLFGFAGDLVNLVTGGLLSRDLSMWTLAVVLVIYVTLGGLRAVAYVTTLQVLLIAVGVTTLGLVTLDLLGGFDPLNRALAAIAGTPTGTWGTTLGYGGGDFNGLFATPGVVQWNDGLNKEVPRGGPWTGVMVMSFMVALMGIQASPAFSMWAFASRNPSAFAPQQVWASACAAGVLLFVFVTLQGLGGLLLGASPEINAAGLEIKRVLPPLGNGEEGRLVANLIDLVGTSAPWLLGIVTVCMIAAIKAAGGAYMTSAGALVTRDLYMRFFNPHADDRLQKRFARVATLLATVAALLMATLERDGMVVLGGLALALAVQLWPALLGVAWVRWFTRQGVAAGIVVGSIVVALTDPLGQALTRGTLPWGQWPWTIHAAAWGLIANFLVCILGSALTRDDDEAESRYRIHRFLAVHAGLSMRKRRFATFAWVAAMIWLFFAVGPCIVIGNYLFGAPDTGYEGWDFRMPSIWAWQFLWWGLGVLLIWLLAYKMELATSTTKEVVALTDDIAASGGIPRTSDDAYTTTTSGGRNGPA